MVDFHEKRLKMLMLEIILRISILFYNSTELLNSV